MADRAKRAAALAGVIGLTALSVPAVTASMVTWSWDNPPNPCLGPSNEAYDADFDQNFDWGYLVCDRPNVPRKYNPATESPSFESICWHSITIKTSSFNGPENETYASFMGFNSLNVNLLWGPQPGDYPPLSLDVQSGTSPLIPSDVPSRRGPWPTLARPTAGGTIDLITGQPLLQETDLEISFGSAVFRHTRTYSGVGVHAIHEWSGQSALWESRSEAEVTQADPSEVFWDWNGQGWMMGEAPLFLMDARYWHWDENLDKPRCYFVQDAHHSIPFLMDFNTSGQPAYVAPQWMDARLDYEGGTWDNTNKAWTTPPTAYFVYLHGGGLKYTIKPLYQQDVMRDFCGETGFDLHHRPNVSYDELQATSGQESVDGLGIPYLGLVTQIEDRNGNIIKLEYCDHEQSVMFGDAACDAENPKREEWVQDGSQKGQIRAVRLYSSGSTTAKWTLLYVYRTFRGTIGGFDATEHNIDADVISAHSYTSRQRALHAIYAYEGDVATPQVNGQTVSNLTIPVTTFESVYHDAAFSESRESEDAKQLDRDEVIAALEAAMAIEVDGSTSLPPGVNWSVPDSWKHHVQYLYTEGSKSGEKNSSDEPIYTERNFFGKFKPDSNGTEYAFYQCWESGPTGRTDHLPRLIASRSQSRSKVTIQGVESTTTQTKFWQARYEDTDAIDNHTFWLGRAIRAVWGNSTLAVMHDAVAKAAQGEPSNTELAFLNQHWPLGLLLLSESAQVPSMSTSEDVSETIPLLQTSELTLRDWHARDGFTQDGKGGDAQNDLGDFWSELWQDYVSPAQADHCVGLNEGIAVFTDRRSSTTSPRVYRFNRFMYLPGDRQLSAGGLKFSDDNSLPDNTLMPLRSLVHAPYIFYNRSTDDQEINFAENRSRFVPNFGEPLWITVVDEFDDESTAVAGLSDSVADLVAAQPVTLNGLPRSRRVVWMNAAGYILKEKVWDMRSGQLTGNSGLLTEGVYDEHARLIELRSAGWGSPNNADRAHSGRIDVYKYGRVDGQDDDTGLVREPTAVGVKQGTTGAVQWLSKIYRHPARTDLIEASIQYTQAIGDNELGDWSQVPDFNQLPTGALMTRTDYTLGQPLWQYDSDLGNQMTPNSNPIYRKLSYAPASASEPSGTARHPFAAEIYNYNGDNETPLDSTQPLGVLLWKGYGQLADISQSQSGDELFWDFTKYDDRGRVTAQIVDAQAGLSYGSQDEGNSGTVGSYPIAALGRQPAYNDATKPALNLTTLYWYESQGKVKTKFPDGRYELVSYRNTSDTSEVRRGLFIFEDGEWRPVTAGDIQKYGGDTALGGSVVTWSDPIHYFDGAEPDAVIADVDIESDSSGRPTQVGISASDTNSVAGKVEYDSFGLAGREIAFDGTRTRKISNMRGQLEMVWRGTTDKHDLWGNVGSGQPDDNMLLLEKNSYGTGIDNALKLVSVRRYRHQITPQDAWDNGFDSLDNAGWLETHEYDWRGRDVLVKRYREGQTGSTGVITTTATHLDHLDRPVLVAEYDGDLPSGAVSPLEIDVASTPPTAADVIQHSGGKLISLTETVYNETGKVRTTRTYDPSDVSKYTESTTYSDSRGNMTWSRSPNAPVTVRVYDSQGREIRSTQLVGTQEIERTDTQRDTVGNAIRVISRERVAGATGDSLDTTNSVRSYRFYWYDNSNRVIAMADAGTMNAANIHVDHGGNDRARPGASVDDPRDVHDPDGPNDPEPMNLFGLNSSWFSGLASGQGDDYQSKNLWAIELTYYDAKGNKTREIVCNKPGVSSDDRVTDYRYDGFGQMIAKVEHTIEGDSTPPRTTYSRYQSGRVVDMGTNPDADEAMFESTLPSSFQKTSLTYGAPIVVRESSGGLSDAISQNNGFIESIEFPSNEDSPPTTISFMYYPDGLIAARTVRRGASSQNDPTPVVAFTYFYDELSRLTELVATYPETLPPPGGRPVDRITRIAYEYDAASRLKTVTAYTRNPDNNNAEEIVAQNAFAYDSMGRLVSEKQQHGGAVTSSSPVVSYAWDHDAARNIERLKEMTYPTRVSPTSGPTARKIEFGFGASNSVADLLSRPGTVTDTSTTGAIGQLAAYTYSGVSRRVGASWGHGTSGVPAASYSTVAPSGVGHSGLDSLGRLAAFTVKNSAGSATPLFEALYGYSPAGDMVSRRVKQATIGSMNPDNVRSALIGYDRLGRLTDHQAGTLGTDSNGDPTISSVWRHSAWTMDTLGNLKGASGSNPAPGLLLETDRNADSTTDTLETTHGTGINNRLMQVDQEDSLQSSPTSTPVVNDRAGNVVSDGTYFYQYDAWNRLIQVRSVGTLAFDSDGNPTSGAPGDWIMHYTYDGLGRLIRRQLPHNLELEQVRVEEFYYDGVRRISETLTTPLFSSGGGPVGGGGGTSSQTYTDREYVWAPPPSGYVDECVCQIDRSNTVRYVIQDASYDVVAIVAPQTQSVASKVIGQYTWDPYGQVLTAEYSGLSASYNKLGHHGLFADRLDANYQGATLAAGFVSSTHLPPRILYNVRNRTYDPTVQRWLQRDPLMSGSVLIAEQASHGASQVCASPAIDIAQLHHDGFSLYQYVRSSPFQGSDPLGTCMLADLGASTGVRGLLAGAIIGGGVGGVNGYLNPQVGVARGILYGAIAGGLGGGYGAMAASGVTAFGASAAGLFGQLMSGATAGMVGGAVGGFVGSASAQSLYNGGVNWAMALADAQWSAILGAVFGAGSGVLGPDGADTRVFAMATSRSVGRFSGSSGELWGRTASGQLEYGLSYRVQDGVLHIKDVMLYPTTGAPQVRIGTAGMRQLFSELAEEARLSGFDEADISWIRMGTTGGKFKRECGPFKILGR